MSENIETSAHAEKVLRESEKFLNSEFNGPLRKEGNFQKFGESFKDYMSRTSDLIKKCPLWRKNFINADGEYYAPSIARENVRQDIIKMGTAMVHGTGVVLGAGAAAVKDGAVTGYNWVKNNTSIAEGFHKMAAKFPHPMKNILKKNAVTAGWEYMAVREYIKDAELYTKGNLPESEKTALADMIKLTEGVRNSYYNKIATEYYGVAPGKNASPFLKRFLDMQCANNVDITQPSIIQAYEDELDKEIKNAVKAGDFEALKKLMPSYSEKPIAQVLDETHKQACKSTQQVIEEAKAPTKENTFNPSMGHGDLMQVKDSKGNVCHKKPVFLEFNEQGQLFLVDANGNSINPKAYQRYHDKINEGQKAAQAETRAMETPVANKPTKVNSKRKTNGSTLSYVDEKTGERKSMELTPEEQALFEAAQADTFADMESAAEKAAEVSPIPPMPKRNTKTTKRKSTGSVKTKGMSAEKRAALYGDAIPTKVDEAEVKSSSGGEMSK